MESADGLRVEAALASTRANEMGLTQDVIARAIGASQSQVSRALSGKGERRSRVFNDVCKYVFSISDKKADYECSAELLSALQDVWDGTPAHARALALVIRSLGALNLAARSDRAAPVRVSGAK